MLNALLLPLMSLAAVGFVLSATAHLLALFGMQMPGGKAVWALHIGLFVVWIPTVFISQQATRFGTQRDGWKLALAGCPRWMRNGLFGLFGYAILNFVVFLITVPKGSMQVGNTAPPTVVRGFSGHWMVFYAGAFAVLYSRINAPQFYRERKCPNGHVVSPLAHFCPDCGYAFPDTLGSA